GFASRDQIGNVTREAPLAGLDFLEQRRLGRGAQGAASLRLFFEYGHAVTLSDQRRIGQSGGTGADDRDTFSAGCLRGGEHYLPSSGAVDHAADASAA